LSQLIDHVWRFRLNFSSDGVGGAVSGDDNVLGEPDAETGGDGGVAQTRVAQLT